MTHSSKGRLVGGAWALSVLMLSAWCGLPAVGADRVVLCEEFTNNG